MAGFLIVDFDLFTKYPQLTDGARILYAFITFKMNIADQDAAGNSYIDFTGDTDPKTALGMTRKYFLNRMKELKEAGLIHTSGKGPSFKCYLGAEVAAAAPEPAPAPTEPTDPPKSPKRDLAENAQVPQTVLGKSPKRHLASPPNGTWPLLSYKEPEVIVNKCVKTTRPRNGFIIPTLEDVKSEATKQGYISDPEAFYLYNQARGWRGITDWRIAFMLWEKREPEHRAARHKVRPVGSITGAAAGIIYDMPAPAAEPERISEASDDGLTIDDFMIDIWPAAEKATAAT